MKIMYVKYIWKYKKLIWNTFRTSRDASRSFPKQIKDVSFCTSPCSRVHASSFRFCIPATPTPTSHRGSHDDEKSKSSHQNCCLLHVRIWQIAAFPDLVWYLRLQSFQLKSSFYLNNLLSSYFEVFYNKKLSLSLYQFTCQIINLQSINCSILRTLASFSNQRNSFRLDIDAIQLKGDHLVECALRVNIPSSRRVMSNFFLHLQSMNLYISR